MDDRKLFLSRGINWTYHQFQTKTCQEHNFRHLLVDLLGSLLNDDSSTQSRRGFLLLSVSAERSMPKTAQPFLIRMEPFEAF